MIKGELLGADITQPFSTNALSQQTGWNKRTGWIFNERTGWKKCEQARKKVPF